MRMNVEFLRHFKLESWGDAYYEATKYLKCLHCSHSNEYNGEQINSDLDLLEIVKLAKEHWKTHVDQER